MSLKIKDFVLVFLYCITSSFLLAQPKENPTLFLANETVVVGNFHNPENQTENTLACNHATIHVSSATVFYYNPNLDINFIVLPEELVQNEEINITTRAKLKTRNAQPETLTNSTTPSSSFFGFYQQMCCVVPTSSFTKKAINTNRTKTNPTNYIAFASNKKIIPYHNAIKAYTLAIVHSNRPPPSIS